MSETNNCINLYDFLKLQKQLLKNHIDMEAEGHNEEVAKFISVFSPIIREMYCIRVCVRISLCKCLHSILIK